MSKSKMIIAPPIKIDLSICNRSKRNKFNRKYMFNNPFKDNEFIVPEACLRPDHQNRANFYCQKVTKFDAISFRNEIYATNEIADQLKILERFIACSPIKKRRNTTVQNPKSINFSYFLPLAEEYVNVCKSMFIAVTGITKSRLEKITNSLLKKRILNKGDIDIDIHSNLSEESKRVLISRKEKVLKLTEGTFEKFSKALKEKNQFQDDIENALTFFEVEEENTQRSDEDDGLEQAVDEESTELNENHDKMLIDICRICLNNDDKLVKIFEKQTDEIHSTAEMMEYVLPCTLIQDDDLPQNICESCLEKVKNACELKTEWIESQRIIESTLEQSKIVCEETKPSEPCLSSYSNNLQIKEEKELHIYEPFDDDHNSIIEFEDGNEDVVEQQNQSESTNKVIQLESSGIIREPGGRWNTIDPSEVTAQNCYLCSQFKFDTTLEEHFEQFHNTYDTTQCSLCNFSTEYPYYLNLHYQVHADDYRICPYCNEKMPRTQYYSHKRSCMPKELRKPKATMRYQCKFCEKTYSNASFRRVHEKIHTKEKLNVCEQCGKSFYKTVLLRQHMLSHGAQTDHQCNICGKFFIVNYRLKKHYEVCSQKNTQEKTVTGN